MSSTIVLYNQFDQNPLSVESQSVITISTVNNRKEFTDLNFQIWRVKDTHRDKWREEIYIIGDDESLMIFNDALQSLLNLFQTYGKGTKKFKCNPPVDFDFKSHVEEHGVQIQWLDWLVVRLGFDALDNEPYILDDFTVELSVNPNTLKQLIERTQAYLDSDLQYDHGADAVCGLRFSPDWLGAE